MADPQHVDTAFVEETSEEPRMPGHESALDRQPQWQPRYPGSGRLAGKVAIVTGGDSDIAANQVHSPAVLGTLPRHRHVWQPCLDDPRCE